MSSHTENPLAFLTNPSHFFPAFAAQVPDEIILLTLDKQSLIQYGSESFFRTLKRDKSGVVGKSLESFLTAADFNERVRNDLAVQVGYPACFNLHTELAASDGQTHRFKLTCVSVSDQGGVEGIVVLGSKDSGNGKSRLTEAETREIFVLAEELTDAERAVVDLVVDGHMNKAMARMLGVAVRTIEARRARAMAKLKVRSLPDLVKAWLIVKDGH